MSNPVPMVEIWRGGHVECLHLGHAVVVDATGAVLEAWGDPQVRIYPRSSAKILQALPLAESAAGRDLAPAQLAIASASHQAAAIHTDLVRAWLGDLGLGDDALRCGAWMPHDAAARDALIRAEAAACQWHNECSGKHCGFLTLGQHLKAGPEYLEIEHPVQQAVWAAFAEMTETSRMDWGIDGCSAPNFICSLQGLAMAMARIGHGTGVRAEAGRRLYSATIAHPEMVAGEGQTCTALIRAMKGQASVKTGADGVFVAMIPERGLGVALKIADGAQRAKDHAMAALLAHLGVLDAEHPLARRDQPITSKRGLVAGFSRALI